MNFKLIVMTSVAALMLGACAHKASHENCQCGAHKEAKEECNGECSVDKKCADCQKTEAAAK